MPFRLGRLLILIGLGFAGTLRGTDTVQVVLATEAGEIELMLEPGRAPGTVANFLHYLAAGFYDGGAFHRTVTDENQGSEQVRIAVIQAGVNPARAGEERGPIALERTRDTGLRHVDGAIAMVRLAPDSATSGFFICVGDQPELDFGGRRHADGQGFAVFGRVVRGMEVVRAIHRSPANRQKLTPPVLMVAARRLPPD